MWSGLRDRDMHVTSFFQDKYKLKKAKKYIVYVTVRRPTARALCQVWEVWGQ